MKWFIAPLVLMIVIGCTKPDTRYAELAEKVVAEQSQQNSQAARQTQQIAEASRELVEADAQSRRELLNANERLQGEVGQQRLIVDQQRDALDSERRQIALDRQQAPLVADAIRGAATLIAMLLPLTVCIYLLKYLTSCPEPAHDLVELLSAEIVNEHAPRISTDEPAVRSRGDASSNERNPA